MHQPELRDMVTAASRALALIDTPRLQELALSCEALNRQFGQDGWGRERAHRELAAQAREAHSDMAVFERVLEATQANLNVMRRLQLIRLGELEYKAPRAQDAPGTGSEDGDD